jgi:hypothetical protein
MTNQVRLIVQTEKVIGLALQLRAGKEGATIDGLVNDLLRKALATEIEEAQGLAPLADVIQEVVKNKGLGLRGPNDDTLSYGEGDNLL